MAHKALHNILGKIGKILDDFGDEGEGARRAIIWILLHQAKEAGRHNCRAEESQEE